MLDEHIREQFPAAAGFLDTASLGLPPRVTIEAMTTALAEWQAGTATAPSYDHFVEEARTEFATMVGTSVENVAIGAQVSAFVALVASVLAPGSHVLVTEGDFTALLFPFLTHDDLRLEVVSSPLGQLAEAIDSDTAMVAFSLVQSADGRVADADAIRAAAKAKGALTLADCTQAAGWLPYRADDFDFTVAGAYKWLLSPRGATLLTVRPELLERVRPLYAGWYAGVDPWQTIYGLPLRLASDASRLDLSPAWLSWVGTAASLRLLNAVGLERIHAHDVGLADLARRHLELEPGDSSMISLALAPDFDPSRLVGLRTAFRGGRLRAGFHLYNSEDDVERLVDAVADARAR